MHHLARPPTSPAAWVRSCWPHRPQRCPTLCPTRRRWLADGAPHACVACMRRERAVDSSGTVRLALVLGRLLPLSRVPARACPSCDRVRHNCQHRCASCAKQKSSCPGSHTGWIAASSHGTRTLPPGLVATEPSPVAPPCSTPRSRHTWHTACCTTAGVNLLPQHRVRAALCAALVLPECCLELRWQSGFERLVAALAVLPCCAWHVVGPAAMPVAPGKRRVTARGLSQSNRLR